MELKRYKDLLSLREKEIDSMRAIYNNHKKTEENLLRKISKLESDNNDLQRTLRTQKTSHVSTDIQEAHGHPS